MRKLCDEFKKQLESLEVVKSFIEVPYEKRQAASTMLTRLHISDKYVSRRVDDKYRIFRIK